MGSRRGGLLPGAWEEAPAEVPVLLVGEPQPAVELSEDDEAAIQRARASIRAGRTISMERLMKLL